MANYNKNLFVGAGGAQGINESHFLSAAFGMERIMGRADTPLRQILNYAQANFCRRLPVVYVLTVVGSRADIPVCPSLSRADIPVCQTKNISQGRQECLPYYSKKGGRQECLPSCDENHGLAVRGLFIGDDVDCFQRAAALSAEVNITILDEPPKKVVVYLDPEEFHSTWLGNKSIYRTRMAIADGGELIVMAPGVAAFGEDPEIDRLIRKYGYCSTPEVMQLVRETDDLPQNLSAASHLIHGSSEGRFSITYCPGRLSREEIESVGYRYADVGAMLARYNPQTLREGWNGLPDGERVFYIGNPALGLWATRERMKDEGGRWKVEG
jgi:hypothetical protein